MSVGVAFLPITSIKSYSATFLDNKLYYFQMAISPSKCVMGLGAKVLFEALEQACRLRSLTLY
jgi:hypothetical protein